VLYLRLIIFLVRDDVSVDNKSLLMTDFVNLKIKPIQSFRYANKDRLCVHVFIGVSAHIYIYMSIYISTVLKKQEPWLMSSSLKYP
jgi:hypothetical protein